MQEQTSLTGTFTVPNHAQVTFYTKGRTTVCMIESHGFPIKSAEVGIVTRFYKDVHCQLTAEIRALEDAAMGFSKPDRTEIFKAFWEYKGMDQRAAKVA